MSILATTWTSSRFDSIVVHPPIVVNYFTVSFRMLCRLSRYRSNKLSVMFLEGDVQNTIYRGYASQMDTPNNINGGMPLTPVMNNICIFLRFIYIELQSMELGSLSQPCLISRKVANT